VQLTAGKNELRSKKGLAIMQGPFLLNWVQRSIPNPNGKVDF
jgi:hypothetical protein